MSVLSERLYNAPPSTGRLGVSTSGTHFIRNGARFKGAGVNHWESFIGQLVDTGVTSNYSKDMSDIFSTLNLSFMRVSFGFFSRTTWGSGWFNNKAGFNAALLAYVADAEAKNAFIAPTLAWDLRAFCEAVYDATGIFQAPCHLAYKHTPAWKAWAEWVTNIVTLTGGSRAIAWWSECNEGSNQLGPEYFSTWKLDGTGTDAGATPLPGTGGTGGCNWGDRPDGSGKYQPGDKMSMAQKHQFAYNTQELIRSLDVHQRMYVPGNALGTAFGVGAQTTNSLSADTLAMWNGTNATENIPWIGFRDKPYDGTTLHCYPQATNNTRFYNGAEKTQAEIIALCRGWSDQVGKPFLLEEWGATYHGDPVDEVSTNLATEQSNFELARVAARTYSDLHAIWNYNGNLAGAYPWMLWKLNDPLRRYQLEAVAEDNITMKASV